MFNRRPKKIQLPTKQRKMFSRRSAEPVGIRLPANMQDKRSVFPTKKTPPSTGHIRPSASRPLNAVRPNRRRQFSLIASNAVLACSIAFAWPAAMGTVSLTRNEIWGLDQFSIKQSLSADFQKNQLPENILLPDHLKKTGFVHYSIDTELQKAMQAELKKYRPDYGMIVAMDAETGKILTMTDIQRNGDQTDNLNLKATYPAASVFKTITAAAAIDLGKADAKTVLPYNGKPTSLYKKQVLNHKKNKWTQHKTLEQAFSKSVNTVFARLGIYTIGGDALMDYADRFLFNHPVVSDLPIQPSSIEMDPADQWSVAETASGYTRGTNISPLHGAMLASAMINDGVMVAPNIVETVTDSHGIILFEADTPKRYQTVTAETAAQMRKLMQRTVTSGSASRMFRGFKKRFEHLEVGGKTGSLTGFHPKGKYDWFVGYATDGKRKIAYAVLCINKEFWYVKSSHLARRLIENIFS
ncbi:MAG: peptidoglycan glycosyltransferase [Gammaproteobacteria bacterium]|jgi:peptidoglycan glycosyltransferase